MTALQKNTIVKLRQTGMRYSLIAEKVGLPKSTVSSFCQRNRIEEALDTEDQCPQCFAGLRHVSGKRKKRFCCDKCRQAWWNARRVKASNRAMERGEHD